MQKTYLDIVKECDNFPYYTASPALYTANLENYYAFKVSGCSRALGYVPKHIIQAFRFPSEGWDVNHARQELVLGYRNHNHSPGDKNAPGDGNNKETLTTLMATTLKQMAAMSDHLPEFQVLKKGWRNETFPISGPDGEILLEIERCASALFGIVTAGVQLTCYVKDAQGLRVWIARRSRTKQTYPGMLDNAAAGGLEAGMAPMEAVVREAVEEASFDEGVARAGIRSTGALSYYHVMTPLRNGHVGLLQPEVEYVYELELDAGTAPRPGDSEVEMFYLWDVKEVGQALRGGEFKLNSAVVVIDFFIRHGVLTPENEPDYFEIVTRLHRRLEFSMAVLHQ